jgi:hypothetical protein
VTYPRVAFLNNDRYQLLTSVMADDGPGRPNMKPLQMSRFDAPEEVVDALKGGKVLFEISG